MKMRVAAAIVLALALAPAPPRACTTFCFEQDGALVFGKNYDWGVDDGLVIVNKRGVAKRSVTENSTLEWTSRHGSVTFNQYGREFPNGGINEKGLVLELMWLDETEYPAPDARGALPTLQWIQYQLDNAATVDEVLASDGRVRIQGNVAKIHFLVADAGGNVAAVEFLDGKLVVHRGDDLPYRALTNDCYAHSVEYARSFNRAAHELSTSSLDRFAVAALAAEAGPPKGATPVDAAFEVLARVAQGEYTQWSIVYDIAAMRVYFRTRAHPEVRWIDVTKLDFDCASPVRVLDLDAPLAGDVTGRFADYSYDANRRLVGASYAQTEFLRDVPAAALDELARYPDATRCAPR
jgi:choloylglycine hydrolase